jgi:regulator of protease activity HflC (stomatin/prohibitin superfamily)
MFRLRARHRRNGPERRKAVRTAEKGIPVIALIVLAVVALFILIVLASAIKIVKEYERGVVFRLGRLVGPRGPGLILLIPFVERMVKVDLRTVTMDVPAQEVITRDNVTVRVNAVSYFRVMDPSAAVNNVTDFVRATSQIAQTTLRSVLGQSALDELLSEREQINQELQKIIDEQTEPWGVKVSIVEVKDVELPQSMQRAMARQAEAEREKRAKIIHAEGEYQASRQLSQAAAVIAAEPVALQLRYLQTLSEIGTEKNTTVVFPLPIELIGLLPGIGGESDARLPRITVEPPTLAEDES